MRTVFGNLIRGLLMVSLGILPSFSYAKKHYEHRVKDFGYLYNDSNKTKSGRIRNTKSYFTLNPTLPTIGPVIDFTKMGSDEYQWQKKVKYTQKIYGALVTSAHSWMTADAHRIDFFTPQGETTEIYWAFMLLALSAPHHESRLTHFRKHLADRCSDYRNTEKWMSSELDEPHIKDTVYKQVILETAEKKREQISKALYNPERPILPECKYLQFEETIQQLMIVNADTGLMQINLDQHEAMRDPDALFNIYRHIDYVIAQWMEEFAKLYENQEKYEVKATDGTGEITCSLESTPYLLRDGYQKSIITGLAHGMWSGKHNQGHNSARTVCRLQNRAVNFEYDLKFRNASLLPILGLDEYKLKETIDGADGKKYYYKTSYTSLFDTYLPKNSVEMRSLQEIRDAVAAYHGVQGKSKALDAKAQKEVFNAYKDIISKSDIIIDTNNISPIVTNGNYYVNDDKLRLYFTPTKADPITYCGSVVPKKGEYLVVGVNELESLVIKQALPSGGPISETWIKVSLPRLRNYEYVPSPQANTVCDPTSLFALAKVGAQSKLEKIGEHRPSEPYYVTINTAKVKNSISTRKGPSVDMPWVASVMVADLPEEGFEVLSEYRSPYDSNHPRWLKLRIREGVEVYASASLLKRVGN